VELFVSTDNSVMISKSESSIVEVDGQRMRAAPLHISRLKIWCHQLELV